ncbi:hypothetical protein J5Y04_24305 [Kitasatospora sp. RG8]|uniref:hypothetical protein n=1 Tax=Kitasatospora sp. RG8 TaxID=2820815 RepID=UPI001ADEE172|nr:hypothetical protein [Kitasatospora sp. RG8]MBP0452641.1 hypothetical protein [Kitasatospora sp. RG8]
MAAWIAASMLGALICRMVSGCKDSGVAGVAGTGGKLPQRIRLARPGKNAVLQYQIVAARRQSFDDKMWQVPAISLAAQAVLLGIVANTSSGHLGRVIAGFLAVGAALATTNLLLRQRRNQEADKAWLCRFEQRAGWLAVHKGSNERAEDVHVCTPFLAKARPHRVWIASTWVFGLLGLSASVYLMVSAGALQ